MNATTEATAVQRRWASHTYARCCLLMLMGGSVVTSCSLHVMLSACGVCPALCARSRGQQKQKKFYRYVRTKQSSCRESREIVLHTPNGKKSFERLPRELQRCSDGAPTSTDVSGRVSRVGILSVLRKIYRTKRCTRKKTKDSSLYMYICTAAVHAYVCIVVYEYTMYTRAPGRFVCIYGSNNDYHGAYLLTMLPR